MYRIFLYMQIYEIPTNLAIRERQLIKNFRKNRNLKRIIKIIKYLIKIIYLFLNISLYFPE